MLSSKGISEYFKGSAPSKSPTIQEAGVFSLCRGGIPKQGSFARLPGKSFKVFETLGSVIQVLEFGKNIVVQFVDGLVLYENKEIFPSITDYVTDNEGNLVYDNFGILVTS